jgi:SLAP domain-containing protein
MSNYKKIVFILLVMIIFSGIVFAEDFSESLKSEEFPAVVSVYTHKIRRTGVFITPTVLITDLDIVRSSYDITIENNRGYKSKVIGAKRYSPLNNLILLEANKSNDFYLDISNNYRFNLKEEIYLIKDSLNSETNIISGNISNIISDNLILTNFSIKNSNNGSPVIKNNEIIGVLFSGNNINSNYENYFLTYKILNNLVNSSKKNETFSLEKVITGPYYKRANEFQTQTNAINMFIKEAYFLDGKLYTSVNINNGFFDRIITGFSNITQTIINERNEIFAKEIFENINLVIPPNKNKPLNLIYENELRFKLDDLNRIREDYNINPIYDKVLVGKLLNNNKGLVKDQLNLNVEYVYWNGDEIAVVINILNGYNSTINKINHLSLDIYDKNGKINKLSYSNSGNITIKAKSSKTMIFRFPNRHIMRKNIKEVDFDSFYIDYDIDYN